MEVEKAQDVAINFVRAKRNVTDVSVVLTELKDGNWIIKGTCPIDLSGHPWRESFEVTIDQKGNVKASSFQLM